MNIYRHWAKAQEKLPERGWLVSCFGGSNEDTQDAHRQAKTRLQRVLSAIRSGSKSASYEQYCDVPLREEVKEEYAAPGGQREAVLTRNGYGALVLNTERVMFMDLDLPAGSLWQWLKGLIGLSSETPEEALRRRLSERLAVYPMLGLRLYRTTAGFRALVTSGQYDPVSAETQEMLKAFGNDPLYRMLCRKQACFRARVSPKPWRLKLDNPPYRYPYANPIQEEACRAWEAAYEERCAGTTVCRFVEHLGTRTTCPEAARMIAVHDRLACGGNGVLA